MSFEPVSEFERRVAAILPHRKRYLSQSPAERDEENKAVIANANPNIKLLSDPSGNDEYLDTVIQEVDRRIRSGQT